MMARARLLLVCFVLSAIAEVLLVSAQQPLRAPAPETTAKRLHETGWWPTKSDAARKDFAGTEACAVCHREITEKQVKTPMGQAAMKAVDTDVLRSNVRITAERGPFKTEIGREKKGSSYTVSRGGEAMTGRLLWSLGQGTMGQTFVLESGGDLFESQLTYFASIGGLDLTPGHGGEGSQEIARAFGERQSPELAARCFGCHTTASSARGQFDQGKAIPGITCEACHGPGAQHVQAMQDHQVKAGKDAILNPSFFDPVKLVDYCGACHRSPEDVVSTKDFVPINVRFQPYRLSKSRCWSRPDRRISCVGCHDPHDQVVRDFAYYDGKCLACHASRAATAEAARAVETAGSASASQSAPESGKQAACRVSSSHCATCHMPKYKVPQMHGSFTDHDIRIVRAGDPYPL